MDSLADRLERPFAEAEAVKIAYANGDPLEELSLAFLHRSASTAAKYDVRREEKGMFLVKQVKSLTGENAALKEDLAAAVGERRIRYP